MIAGAWCLMGRPGTGNRRIRRDRTLGWVNDATAGQRRPAEAGSALDAEDLKIITLARSTRARTGQPEGAAVRDETGRTYTAATVALPSLRLSALRLAVAMAASSGAESLEAAAVVTEGEIAAEDLVAVRDLGAEAVLFVADPDGTLRGAR